jgi:hypothetical protein
LNVEMPTLSQQTTTFKNYDKYILMICSKIQHRRSYRFLRKIRCHWKSKCYDRPENTRRSTWNVESVVYYQSVWRRRRF